jgi:lipopolysaccharide/colanic/teichoic acid biosynthesis glycosyltransferase
MSHEKRQAVKELGSTYKLMKRFIDLLLGSILLLLSSPVFLVAALAIRLETEGNPFFLQKRVGLGGRSFTIVKLRGMYIDSKVRFAHLYDYKSHENLDFHFHAKEDPRITRVGAFVRRTSIDELPNLLNVVLGQMTLVGPRPEVPEMLELYGEYEASYLSIKPGVTCISKISGRDRLSKQESIEMDLSYLDNMTTNCDLSILWRTLCCVLLRQDVYDGKPTVDTSTEQNHGTQLGNITSFAAEQTHVGSL